jgi:hypothetical protein
MLVRMNRLNNSVLPLVGLSVVLSLSAVITVAARWPENGTAAAVSAVAVQRSVPVQSVRVVMHDPGCHWFQTADGLKRSLTIKGPVRLTNMDEATLRVAGGSGAKLDKVGSVLRLQRGTYHITMVGQAPDDNHLKLVVS